MSALGDVGGHAPRAPRTLLRRPARGYAITAPPWAESLSPLGKAIMEPPHQGSRPDLAALIAKEEAEEAEAA